MLSVAGGGQHTFDDEERGARAITLEERRHDGRNDQQVEDKRRDCQVKSKSSQVKSAATAQPTRTEPSRLRGRGTALRCPSTGARPSAGFEGPLEGVALASERAATAQEAWSPLAIARGVRQRERERGVVARAS